MTFCHSALCPRCHASNLMLRRVLERHPDVEITKVEILRHRAQAKQDGVSMIPALGADGRKISGVILTPERIDNLADVMPNGKEFLVTQPAEGAASFNIRAKTGK